MRFVADDRQVAAPRRCVQRQLRHRQRFEIAAHRGDRRRELVRDVGEQLTANAVGCGERLGARGEVAGHRVEGAGDGGDLVAAAIGRARGQVAGAETARRGLERAQPSPGRAEDHRRGQHGADDQHAGRDQREHRREAAEQESERRLRRHDDDARQASVDHDRRWTGGEALAAAAAEGTRRRTAASRAFRAFGRSAELTFEAGTVGPLAAPAGRTLRPAQQRGARHRQQRFGDRRTCRS